MWVIYIFISVIEIIALGKRLGAIFDFMDFLKNRSPVVEGGEIMDSIRLVLATEKDAELLHRLQVEAFMPLYEKYHDDETNPAKESLNTVRWKITDRTKSDFYIIEFENKAVGGVRVRNHNGGNITEGVRWISPIFVIPKFQGKGIAQKVIQKVFELYPDTLTWKLDTIKQEPGNGHLYEKCGFVRYGDEDVINGKMTLVKYEKSCVRARRITEADAEEVSKLVVRNFLEINSKDYGLEPMKQLAGTYNADKILQTAGYAHMYVFEWKESIIGVGAISSFWGSETESILLTIFVQPELHGKGIGRQIIRTLENDELFTRANRIEIPASITATEFYRKCGYDYKNGIKELDEEWHYRLEKFKEV